MARLEKQSNIKEEISKMKGEVVKEVRRGTKTKRPKLTCSLLFLAFLAATLAWILWIVAATGLIHIPFFSQLAYNVPTPERIVQAGVPFEQILDEQFSTTLTKRLQEGNGSLEVTAIELSLREDSLTASLRSTLEEMNLDLVDPSNAQVMVVDSEGFQLFIPVNNSKKETAIQLSLFAEAVDGMMELQLGHVRLGSADLPAYIVASLLSPIIQQYVNELNDAMSSYATVTNLQYQEGRVDIIGTFTVEISE
jgi:hypothetical protein